MSAGMPDIWNRPVSGPRPSWFALCVASWLAMLGAVVATAPWLPDLAVEACAVLVVGFAVVSVVPFTRLSPWVMNWISFYACVLLGAWEFVRLWPQAGLSAFEGVEGGFALLVRGFVWVMVFRSWALRTPSDASLCVVPALSTVILVLVAAPTVTAGLGTLVLVMATLYLLATEASVRAQEEAPPLQPREVRWEGSMRAGTSVNTWQLLAVVVVVAVIGAGLSAPYLQVVSQFAEDLQTQLARVLARKMMGSRPDLSPEARVRLTGGTPVQDSTVLFTVTCERGENWRQETYSHYDGTAWTAPYRTRRLVRARRTEWGWQQDLSAVSGLRGWRGTRVRQEFQMQVPFSAALPALFMASEIAVRVGRIGTGEDGVVRAAGYVMPGRSYEVISWVPIEGGGAGANPLPPLPPELRERYLQLPDTVTGRVRDLARQLAQGTRGPLDTAVAIRGYLVDNYPYTLRVPRAPRDRDFVDDFLFEAGRGYCVHFATAMAVLCRCQGIPARFVTGFTAGEDKGNDTYEVRAKDAHSWVEVYIEGSGWQSFDPTPPADERPGPVKLAAVAKQAREWLLDRGRALSASLLRHWPQVLMGMGGLAGLGLLGWLGVLAIGRARRRRSPPGPAERVRKAYWTMAEALARQGIARRSAEAPLEYLRRLDGVPEAVREPADEVTQGYLRSVYGPQPTTSGEAVAVEAAGRAFRLAAVRRRLLRQWLAERPARRVLPRWYPE